MVTDDTVHLHRDDCPQALAVLEAVLNGRPHPDFAPTETGAYVDWELLRRSFLSSTETGAVIIAEGIARIEQAGRIPPNIAPAVTEAIRHVT